MRVKTGIVRHRKHNKLRKQVKGYRGMRRTTIKGAKQATMKAGQHAYVDRRKKKRVFRALWITRLSAAVQAEGMNYSRFIKGLKDKKIDLDRKSLSELAIHEPEVFAAIVKQVSAQ